MFFFGVIAMSLLITQRQLAAVAGFKGISQILGATLQHWQSLKDALFDAYRPELRYMRGAGPKWREKHPDMS